jgi:cytochrome c peroxidase
MERNNFVMANTTWLRSRNLAGFSVLLMTLGFALVLPGVLRAVEGDAPLVPLPEAAVSPAENPATAEKVALGKQLFFDPRLSGGNDMSCASCHLPEKALADGLPRAKGAGGKDLTRNTPTLWNVALQDSFFWDGRARSLEEQALFPIESPDEMAQDLEELVAELAAIPGYARQFQAVFGGPVSAAGIAQALAAFQRTLITPNAPFDRYLAGEKNALSREAQQGLEVFRSSACVRCHQGPLLSDGRYYRLTSGGSDLGREAATGNAEHRYKFRTPSLRNVAETGPYMHDGSEQTLFDAVALYFRSTAPAGPGALPVDFEPLLGRSYSEIDALVEFLRSLSGEMPQIAPPELP